MRSQTNSTRYFEATMALAGFALATGLFVVLRYLQIPFYLYYPRFTDTILFSAALDNYVFVAATFCVPASLVLYVLQRKARKLPGSLGLVLPASFALWLVSLVLMSNYPSLAALTLLGVTLSVVAVSVLTSGSVYGLEWRRAVSEMLVPLLTVFALVEFAPLYYWGISSINPGTQIGREAAELELNLTYSAFPLEPLIIVGLLSSWIWGPAIFRILRAKRTGELADGPSGLVGRIADNRALVASIDLILILAILVFYYPYFAGQTWLVGVDSYMNYYDPLVEMSRLKISGALQALSSTFHGVYVGLLLVVQLGTGLSSFAIVKYAPLVLAVTMSVAVFWVVLESTRKRRLAILAALGNLFWFPTTMGIFGGLQANWAALALWMLFLGFMLRPVKTKVTRVIYLLVQAVLSAGILLIHPWTWGVFAFTILVVTLLLYLERSPLARTSASGLFSTFVLSVPAGAAAVLAFPGVRKDALNALMMYISAVPNLLRLSAFWKAFSSVVADWSSFLSPILLIICLIGTVDVVQRKDWLSKGVLAWVVAWSVGSTLAPSEWRMLYVSPLAVLLAFGVERFMKLSARMEPVTAVPGSLTMRSLLAIVGTIATCSALLVAFPSPTIRLIVVVVAVVLISSLAHIAPGRGAVRILIGMILVLIIVNGAFRSLYPLLLDPHNLHRQG